MKRIRGILIGNASVVMAMCAGWEWHGGDGWLAAGFALGAVAWFFWREAYMPQEWKQ